MAAWEDLPLLQTLSQRSPLGRLARPPLGRFTTLLARAAEPNAQPLAAYLVGFPIPTVEEAESSSLSLPPFTGPEGIGSPPAVQARETSSPAPSDFTAPRLSIIEGEGDSRQNAESRSADFPSQRNNRLSPAALPPEIDLPTGQQPPIQRQAECQRPEIPEESSETTEIPEAEEQIDAQTETVVPDAIAQKLPQIPLPTVQRHPLGRARSLGSVGKAATEITQQLRQKHRESVDAEETASVPESALPEAFEHPTPFARRETATPDLRPGIEDAGDAIEPTRPVPLDQTNLIRPQLDEIGPQPDETPDLDTEPTANRDSKLPQADVAPIQPRVVETHSGSETPALEIVEDIQARRETPEERDTQNSMDQSNRVPQTYPPVDERFTPATFNTRPEDPLSIADRPKSLLSDDPEIPSTADAALPIEPAPDVSPAAEPLQAKQRSDVDRQITPKSALPQPVTDGSLNTRQFERAADEIVADEIVADESAADESAADEIVQGAAMPKTPVAPIADSLPSVTQDLKTPSPETDAIAAWDRSLAIAPVQGADTSDRPLTSPEQPHSPATIPQTPPQLPQLNDLQDLQPQSDGLVTSSVIQSPLANPQPDLTQAGTDTEQLPISQVTPSPPVQATKFSASAPVTETSPIQRRTVETPASDWEDQFNLEAALPEPSAFQDTAPADASLSDNMLIESDDTPIEEEADSLADSIPAEPDEAEESFESIQVTNHSQPIDPDDRLNDLAKWIYADLRSHLHCSQATHYGLHPSLPLRPVLNTHSMGRTQRAVDLFSLPPPQLLQLTTVVRQQVESRLQQDRERQPTPYLPRL